MKEETYLIEGMTCASCSSAVERVTRKMEGVERSDVNLATNRMVICYDEALVSPEKIKAKVEKAGFGIKEYEEPVMKVGKNEAKAASVKEEITDNNKRILTTYKYP